MITEDYVSFEIAKLLKEKGFGVPTTSVWVDHFKLVGCPAAISIYPTKENWNATTDSLKDIYASAPTLQTAMKWLREEKGIYIEIRRNLNIFYFKWYIQEGATDKAFSEYKYKSYEEAVEEAIKYCLKHLI